MELNETDRGARASDGEGLARTERLARLTRGYARYSKSAGGLASVLGGGLALVAYVMGALAPPEGLWGRLALASAPFVWIGVKEALRRRYYQPLGRVEEPKTDYERRWHPGLTLFTAAVSLAIVVVVAWESIVRGGGLPPAGMLGYLAIIALMPVLVWYFMRTPVEFIVGVFLVCHAALMLGGNSYALWEQPQAPIAAVVLVGLGIKQHLEFRRLRRELVEVQQAGRVGTVALR